jgi:hypothetical protein
MQWVRNNVVGLLGILGIMGSSLVTLYVKAEVNSGAIVQLKETVALLSDSQSNQSVAMQSYAIKTVQLEGQISRFAKTNDRLIIALDKLDVLYGALMVTDAIQDEKISHLGDRIDDK